MKKVLTTILAFVYLSTSMGATIHLHYCMGKLTSWGLIDHESRYCGQRGMIEHSPASPCMVAKKDCCKDEHKQIKTDKDQKLFPSEIFLSKYLTESNAVNEFCIAEFKTFSSSIEYPNVNAPPLSGRISLFVLYRNFRL